LGAKGVVDVGLQSRELLVGNGLGMLVTSNVDIDDAARVNVWWKED
jgi:hypothetical protein